MGEIICFCLLKMLGNEKRLPSRRCLATSAFSRAAFPNTQTGGSKREWHDNEYHAVIWRVPGIAPVAI